MTTPTKPTGRPRIYSHMTKSRFLNFEDSLEIGKIRLFAGEYIKGQGMKTTAYHFIDVEDARAFFSDMSWGKPIKWIDYKGSVNGEIISRVLSVNFKPTEAPQV